MSKKDNQVNPANLVVILDKSGSMSPQRNDTIGSLNSYFSELSEKPGLNYKVWLTLFDTDVTKLFTNTPIEDVKLSRATYDPSGGTALLDAVGKTVSGVIDRGRRTLVVIYTDGEENASRTWTQASVKSLIEEKRKSDWEFVFLGANQDAWKIGTSYGIFYGGHADPLAQHATFRGLVGSTVSYSAGNELKLSNNAGTSGVFNAGVVSNNWDIDKIDSNSGSAQQNSSVGIPIKP